MADTPQNTAAAAGTSNGSPSDATGSPATSQADVDPLTAAIMAEMGDDEGDASQNGDTTTDETHGEGEGTDETNPGNGEGGEGDETQAGDKPNGDKADAIELPEEIDPEKPPKGLEGVPKPVWKRIQTQSQKIRDLTQQVSEASPIEIAATPSSPLAHVQDLTVLKQEIQTAKNIRQLLGGLKAEDFADDGKGGVAKAEIQVGNQVFRFTQNEVESKLAFADAVLDPEVLTERQNYIQRRAESKPQEAAEAVLPGVLKKGTPENASYLEILKSVPELAYRLPNFEYVIACVVRGEKQFKEEKEGKARYVRMELDKDGKVVPPKSPAAAPAKNTAAPKSGARPPTQGGDPQGSRKSAKEVLSTMDKATPEERLSAALAAELGD